MTLEQLEKMLEEMEGWLLDYYAIKQRDFMEMGDFARANRLLTNVIKGFREVGGQENLALAVRLEEERNANEEWFIEICKAAIKRGK